MPSGVPKDETLLSKYPGLTLSQARVRYIEEARINARLGGSAKNENKGFGSNPELARIVGAKGRALRMKRLRK